MTKEEAERLVPLLRWMGSSDVRLAPVGGSDKWYVASDNRRTSLDGTRIFYGNILSIPHHSSHTTHIIALYTLATGNTLWP